MNTDILKTIPTPYYLYDTQLLRQTLDTVREEAARHADYHVHYAVKANADARLLGIIRDAGLGIDCVSGGEIRAALQAGFDPKSIFFAGVGKTDSEITLALQAGIGIFNVESLPELQVISELASDMGATANVCLRINPEVGAHTHSHITTGLAENKFGIAMGDMEKLIRLCDTLPSIHFRGLHFHIGSQILQMDDFRDLALRINELQDELESKGIKAEIIDVGGGLGIDYEQPHAHPVPDFKAYFDTYQQYLRQREGQEVHFELGRSIVAQCGTLVTGVVFVKQGAVKQFAIVDAGMTDLIRPALYDAHHFIENLTAERGSSAERYDVVGPICESSDVFATDIPLPHTRRGDLLAIRSAGAYGQTMASNYNCRPFAKAYYTDQLG